MPEHKSITGSAAHAEPLKLTSLEISGQKLIADFSARLIQTNIAMAAVKDAMKASLFDPASAVYEDVRLGRNKVFCGKVNAKNRYGAYVGFRDFVVSKKSAFLSNNNDGLGDYSRYDYFNLSYATSCASISASKAYFSSFPTTPENSTPYQTVPTPEQEPDSVLDAPPARIERKVSRDTPTV